MPNRTPLYRIAFLVGALIAAYLVLGNLGQFRSKPAEAPVLPRAAAEAKVHPGGESVPSVPASAGSVEVQVKATNAPASEAGEREGDLVFDPSGYPVGRTTPPILSQRVSWTDMLARIDRGEFVVARLNERTHALSATIKDGTKAYETLLPPDDKTTTEHLLRANVDLEVVSPEDPSGSAGMGALFYLVVNLLPVALLIGFFVFMMRRQAGGPLSGAAGMAKSRMQSVNPAENPVRLRDVAGCDEAKAEVAEIVTFLRAPENYHRVGARGPKGVLMAGEPGTGKTLLAKAIAGEANVPFFFTSGSDFLEMFVGVGAARVRDMFQQAKQHAPCIVFIDEIDAVGRSRGNGGIGGGGHDERDQTLNALLVEMDGFGSSAGVVVIAATNRPDVLDPALRRPGRFDRIVTVPLPDREGRTKILAIHSAKVPVEATIKWDVIARSTPGFSGADLANLVNEAAQAAAREGSRLVTQKHLEWARDRVMMGAERKGGLRNAGERKVVAYHEAGHAIVGHFTPGADPIHKITIAPRGQSLGLTMSLPEEEVHNHDRQWLTAHIDVLLGGRAAEDVALNTATVGASNDFERANTMARNMVARWGMSDELGLLVVDSQKGFEGAQPAEGTLQRIDDAVKKLLHERYAAATALLRDKMEQLHAVAKALMDDETVDAERFRRLVSEPLENRTAESRGTETPAA